jgi:hypothetical protein
VKTKIEASLQPNPNFENATRELSAGRMQKRIFPISVGSMLVDRNRSKHGNNDFPASRRESTASSLFNNNPTFDDRRVMTDNTRQFGGGTSLDGLAAARGVMGQV